MSNVFWGLHSGTAGIATDTSKTWHATRQQQASLLDRMRSSIASSPSTMTDNELKVFQMLLMQHAHMAFRKLQNNPPDSNMETALPRTFLLKHLMHFPNFIARKMRGNSDFFSSNKNKFLPADIAWYELVNLLSYSDEQIRQDHDYLKKCQTYTNVLKELTSNPASFNKDAWKQASAASVIAILVAGALIAAGLLFITSTMPLAGSLTLGVGIISAVVCLVGTVRYLTSVETDVLVVQHTTETLPRSLSTVSAQSLFTKEKHTVEQQPEPISRVREEQSLNLSH